MKAIKFAEGLKCDTLKDIEQKKLCAGLTVGCAIAKNLGLPEDVCIAASKIALETWDSEKFLKEIEKAYPKDIVSKMTIAIHNYIKALEEK